MGHAIDQHAAEQRKAAQADMFRFGRFGEKDAHQAADHVEQRAHDAVVETAEGLGGLHLLTDDEARPGLGLAAGKERCHPLHDLAEERARLRFPDGAAAGVGTGQPGTYALAHSFHA